ncbi:MAG: 2-amino-4-hydroxy-6-hydroxymethyldihydropteridine diphosphokinase [Desulfobulbales bacterium]
MTIAYIGLGSNLGDSLLVLQQAWLALGRQPGIQLHRLSSPYRTRPVGMVSTHWFINAAGSVLTTLHPEELLDILLDVEKQFGRIRDRTKKGYQDRELDFDLLMYGDCVQSSRRLVLPHSEMHKRLFVLWPMSEIARDVQHPVLKRSMYDLLCSMVNGTDDRAVQKITWQGAMRREGFAPGESGPRDQ